MKTFDEIRESSAYANTQSGHTILKNITMDINRESLKSELLVEDEEARYESARAIARLGRTALPMVEEWARDARPRIREMAAFILGQVHDPESESRYELIKYDRGLDILIHLLTTDEDIEVRSNAAFALGQYADPASAHHLVAAASDASDLVRYSVATALGSYCSSQWTPENSHCKGSIRKALLKLMDDNDDDVRDWATFGIHQGGHNTITTRRRLWQALDDPICDVRGEAAEGLAIFRDRTLIPRLDQLLRDDEDISPCYFRAAEELGDPILLPAVLCGQERWRETMEEGEKMHFYITDAIETLEKAQAKQDKRRKQ